MSPDHHCVETVKEMMAEVMREKNELVERLNAMHQRIAAEEDPVTKVRRKVEWAAEKERSVEALNKIVASLQRALEEDDISTNSSTASIRSSASIAASRPHGASIQAFSTEHASSADQADFESAAGIVQATPPTRTRTSSATTEGAAEPRKMQYRCSSAPPHTPASKASAVLRSFSSGASQLPQQVRKSVRNRARKFSASFLRKVGWNPSLQESGLSWDYSI